MIAIPAIHIQRGQCVQTGAGANGRELVRHPDPVAVARLWAEHGFTRLHVVDLDGATGRGTNARVVEAIVGLRDVEVQVGGGIRDDATIERLLGDGAAQVVVGTRAVEDGWWLEEIAGTYAGQVIVAADVRDRQLVTRGRERTVARSVFDLVEELNDLPLAGVLVTALHRAGRLEGADLPLMEDVAEESGHRVLGAGGVGSIVDLWELEDRGLFAAVIGSALYSAALDIRRAADEFR